jgi:DNA repair protein RadC
MIIRELPTEERPREKLLSLGSSAVSNAELLAILIGTGTKDRSALELASAVLASEEDGLGHLAGCTPEELCRISGMGIAKACRIIAAFELGKRLATRPLPGRVLISSPDSIADLFMEEMRYYRKEFFKVLLLNSKGEIISIEKTSIGDLSSTIVHPREIFSGAIRRSAAAVVFVHNHPSGNPEPSSEDQEVTLRLTEAGNILGIRVLDHIIIGDGVYVSFRQRNLIPG